MPDDTTPGGTGAPAAPVIAPVPTAAPAQAAAPPLAALPVAPPAAEAPVIDPNWLAQRLDRAKASARNDTLKELGAESLDAAKLAIKAANDAAELKKTVDQRIAELGVKATAAEQAAARHAALLKEQSSRMMMVLTADQQKAITDFAGDDPEQQLRAIHHFAPLWSAQLQQAPAPAPAAAPAPPATTAPPPGAPPGAAPGSPPDHRAVYAATQRTNPFAAAAYGLQHFSAVHIPKT